MDSLKNLKTFVTSSRASKTQSALRLASTNPQTAATLSKLRRDSRRVLMKDEDRARIVNRDELLKIAASTRRATTENEDVFQLFPDMELAVQVTSGMVLSPRDMINTSVNYKFTRTVIPTAPARDITSAVEEYIEREYGITADLPETLRESYFTKGSHIMMYLPENIVDEVINGQSRPSMEALKDLALDSSYGFLGSQFTTPPTAGSGNIPSAESFFQRSSRYDKESKVYFTVSKEDQKDTIGIPVSATAAGAEILPGVEVTDNFNFIKVARNKKKILKRTMESIIRSGGPRGLAPNTLRGLNVSAESMAAYNGTDGDKDKKLTPLELRNVLYKPGESSTQHMVTIDSIGLNRRKSIGKPLALKIPSVAAAPVYTPGNEKDHIAYFLFLDEDGNFITEDTMGLNFGDDAQAILTGSSGFSSTSRNALITRASNNINGSRDSKRQPTIQDVSVIYAEILEKNLLNRLANGINGRNVRLADNSEIYRVMFARTLSGRYTRVLYVPAEMVSYIAFRHFNNGVGKSIIEDVKNLIGVRATILMSKVFAYIRSSINTTTVDVDLDPDDPDVIDTVENVRDIVTAGRRSMLMFNNINIDDLTHWIQRAGITINPKGHKGLPEMAYSVTAGNTEHKIPDNEFDEDLRKQTYMAFGISPEQVDNAFDPDFATTSKNANLNSQKRAGQIRSELMRQISERVRMICTYDMEVREIIREKIAAEIAAIKTNLPEDHDYEGLDDAQIVEMILTEYIESLYLEIPDPDGKSTEIKSEDLKTQEEMLETALNYFIGDEMIASEEFGEIAQVIKDNLPAIKAHFMRQWMADNDVMPQLLDLVTQDEDGQPNFNVFNLVTDFMKKLVPSFVKQKAENEKIKAAADTDVATIKEGNPDAAPGGEGGAPLSEDAGSGEGTPPVQPTGGTPDDDFTFEQ